MRYVVARFNQNQRDAAYRIYITDALKILTENTSRQYGGAYLTARYIDAVEGEQKNEDSAKLAEEIITRMKEGLNKL